MGIRIEPLSEVRLMEAVDLVNLVFPPETQRGELSHLELGASLDSERYADYLRSAHTIDTRYWLGIEEEVGRVVGTTGLYHPDGDYEFRQFLPKRDGPDGPDVWLGYFCVHPDSRGRGTGSKLLDFSVEEARGGNHDHLRLYTSNNPIFDASQQLYDKMGLVIVNQFSVPGYPYDIMIREKRLIRTF